MESTLTKLKERQKHIYCKTRKLYPEIARQAKRNVQAIDKQITIAKRGNNYTV